MYATQLGVGTGIRREHLFVVHIAQFFQIMHRKMYLKTYLNKKGLRKI